MLPGVGAFADCRRGLAAVAGPRSGIVRGGDRSRPAVSRHLRRHAADGRARPRVRDGRGPRLDRRRGRRRSNRATRRSKIPHMGWNEIDAAWPIIRCSPGSPPVRTPISSTATISASPIPRDLLAETDYGGPLAAVIGRDNLVGTQFHPEKSQVAGLRLIAQLPAMVAMTAVCAPAGTVSGRAADPVHRHRSRRSLRGNRERDHRGRRLWLAQAAAAAGAGELLERRAAGARAPARRRPARRRHRRLGAARPGAAQQRGAGLRGHPDQRAFVAPWARGRGIGRGIVREIERLARELGLAVLNLDLRDTQRAAIGLYESLGYRRWGTHPVYAQVDGRIVPGHYYYKLLEEDLAAAVILFPAIDLKDGACVRLVRGEMASATVFNHDPAAQAPAFRRRRVSLAACRRPQRRLCRALGQRRRRCEAIRGAVDLRIQLGGGIRDRAAIECWLDARHRPGRARHRRVARPRAGAARRRRPSRPHRRRHRRARRPGRGRRLGRDDRDRRPSSSPGVSRMPGSRRSSTPTSPATAR